MVTTSIAKYIERQMESCYYDHHIKITYSFCFKFYVDFSVIVIFRWLEKSWPFPLVIVLR